MTLNTNTARTPSGAFRHPYGGERPQLPPRKLSMFSDENEHEQGRVIEDVQWRAKNLLQTERRFEQMVLIATSGPETARPALYEAGGIYSLCLIDRSLVHVKRVYSVGINWHYQVELVAVAGACCQLKQNQMVALKAQRGYRGYETDLPNTEWGAAEYVPPETKDRIAAA